ncbi:MAG TPA: hypothetical protein VJ464_23935 [Blastocatellia bacterium]|nr:hypothetical protein [Blastocatellia bacterium]
MNRKTTLLALYFSIAICLLYGCNSTQAPDKQSTNATPSKSNAASADSQNANTSNHEVIYKVGQYPSKPDWMTQKQWGSYIDWESKQIHQQETPARSVEAQIRKALSNVLGRNQIRVVTVVPGSGAARPIEGQIAMVDVYSDQSRDHAQERAVATYLLVLNAVPSVNRVLVTVYLRQEQKGFTDHSLYSMQVDRGERPVILQEFTPLR